MVDREFVRTATSNFVGLPLLYLHNKSSLVHFDTAGHGTLFVFLSTSPSRHSPFLPMKCFFPPGGFLGFSVRGTSLWTHLSSPFGALQPRSLLKLGHGDAPPIERQLAPLSFLLGFPPKLAPPCPRLILFATTLIRGFGRRVPPNLFPRISPVMHETLFPGTPPPATHFFCLFPQWRCRTLFLKSV